MRLRPSTRLVHTIFVLVFGLAAGSLIAACVSLQWEPLGSRRTEKIPEVARVGAEECGSCHESFEGGAHTRLCIDCHEDEARTWEFTKHAGAFDSLVKHGDDHDPECVSCHVAGFDQPAIPATLSG